MKRRDVKKLSLSRETLKTLDDSRLDGVVGGGVTIQFSNCHCTFECTGNCG
jgi:hypothetical protein